MRSTLWASLLCTHYCTCTVVHLLFCSLLLCTLYVQHCTHTPAHTLLYVHCGFVHAYTSVSTIGAFTRKCFMRVIILFCPPSLSDIGISSFVRELDQTWPWSSRSWWPTAGTYLEWDTYTVMSSSQDTGGTMWVVKLKMGSSSSQWQISSGPILRKGIYSDMLVTTLIWILCYWYGTPKCMPNCISSKIHPLYSPWNISHSNHSKSPVHSIIHTTWYRCNILHTCFLF